MSQSVYRDDARAQCTPDGGIAEVAMQAAPPAVGALSNRVEVSIAGMTCGHCVSSVRGALEALPGADVHRVEIGSASVSLKPGATSASSLLEAIRAAGYQASIGPVVASSAKPGLPQAPRGGGCCSTR